MEREGEKGEEVGAALSLGGGAEIERAKQRCRTVIDRILSLPPKPSRYCYQTLVRLAQSELSFLSRHPSNSNSVSLRSFNIGHVEAVLRILEQPFVNGVSRVRKSIAFSPFPRNGSIKADSKTVHVDIVCTLDGKPVWFLVSARNPKYVSWCGNHNKSLRNRIQQILEAATLSPPSTKPSSIILFFSNGLDDDICGKLEHEFGASQFGMEFPHFDFDCNFYEELEGEWIYVHGRSYRPACVLEIKVDHSGDAIPKTECGVKDWPPAAVTIREDPTKECTDLNLGGSFCSLISRMRLHPLNVKQPDFAQRKVLPGEADLINFDTTALIALISGISNGSADKLLAKPESELRQRFKSNFEFVIAQVMSEIHNPIHVELDNVLSEKGGIICESVCLEFKELVSMCGGPNEKSRADHLLKCFMIVRDSPSERMMSLPTTRKLALKNKVVFGTGDHWGAPTLTSNMGFVRAVSQSGMSLFTIGHRPRALTGD